MTKRTHRYEPTPFATWAADLSKIREIPREAVRPLAALIRFVGTETESWEAEIWQKLRYWLEALIANLEARGAFKSDAIAHARALLDLDLSHRTRPTPRATLVTHAVGILQASGCTTDQALTIVGDIYPLLGWSTAAASRSTVRRQHYSEKTKELRAIDAAGWQRIRDRYKKIADIIDAKDRER